MPEPLTDLSRLCIHTMTTKAWNLETIIDQYTRAGVPGITVWRNCFDAEGLDAAARRLHASGLNIASLCRGGFFPARTPQERQTAIDDNLRAVDEAAAIGAPLIVLVCGSVPGQSLDESRRQIMDGIAAVAPHAKASGVKLAIEPLHPMYAGDRCAVNTLAQANDMVQALGLDNVGVTIDVYHLWWDPALQSEIRRAGQSILSYHVSDWRTPTRDLLNDRGLMGEGCIDLRTIRGWVEEAGFTGPIEVEIFSTEHWAEDPSAWFQRVKSAYLVYV